MNKFFTSESVTEGHPDKICDQISDAIVDKLLAYDPQSKVACETLVTTGQVVIAGEVKSEVYIDLMDTTRRVINEIGYNKSEYKFDGESCGVLNAIHEVLNGKGKVITVCGAGGNRDHGKRPLMAQEAVRQSDKVILTSDNPRNEDPQAIIDDMLAGLDAQQRRKVITITDRREAIRTACMMAEKGDVVLVAGKGHETYQEINGVKHHFDDHEVLRDIFNVK